MATQVQYVDIQSVMRTREAEARRKSEELQKKIEEYRMPPAVRGMTVLFYMFGDPNRAPHIGRVQDAYANVLTVVTPYPVRGSYEHRGVRYILDPELSNNENYAAMGSWDYTDFDKAEWAVREDMNKRINALEEERTLWRERFMAIEADLRKAATKASKKAE